MSGQASPSLLAKALALAERAHAGQLRKGTPIPYIAHPMAVAGLVLDYGGTLEQAAAAMLHDVIEDGGARYAAEITRDFGAKVRAIVDACTDGTAKGKAKRRSSKAKRAYWKRRKLRYIKRLREESDDAVLVSACDKLHNARAIVNDLEQVGDTVFERFTTGREGTLWYYGAVLEILEDRECPVAPALAQAVARMRLLAKPSGADGNGVATTTPSDAFLKSLDPHQRRELNGLLTAWQGSATSVLRHLARAMSVASDVQQDATAMLLRALAP